MYGAFFKRPNKKAKKLDPVPQILWNGSLKKNYEASALAGAS
jgi:hypothetical protein